MIFFEWAHLHEVIGTGSFPCKHYKPCAMLRRNVRDTVLVFFAIRAKLLPKYIANIKFRT